MDYYTIVIIVTFFAFSALAAALLFPVYRFLKREEADGHAFTKAVKEAKRESARESIQEESRSNPASSGQASGRDPNREQR